MNLEMNSRTRQNVLVSIVVPIFNMAGRLQNLYKWLPEAEALGFQVVLVCNCCSDSTRSELEEFIKLNRLENVTVQECNVPGPGIARNYGKRFCKGEFTLFWDSDDIGHPNLVREAVSAQSDFDILVCASDYEHLPSVSKSSVESCSLNKLENFSSNPGLWRCVFRTNGIAEIEFGDSKMGEDQVFIARLLTYNPRIVFNSKIIYTYIYGSSHQLTASNRNIAGLLRSARITEDLIEDTPAKYMKITTTFTLRMTITGIKRGKIYVKALMFYRLINVVLIRNLKSVNRRERIKIFLKIIRNKIYA